MPKHAASSEAHQATTVTLPVELLTQAKALDLDLSGACARGLRAEIAERRTARWLEENRDALAAYNDFVEQTGIPLSEFRQF